MTQEQPPLLNNSNNITSPLHIAFIMDGNRRYAKKKNITQQESYTAGIENMCNIAKECIAIGTQYVTFFAFSIENWHRSKKNINAIMLTANKLLNNKYINDLIKNGAKILFIGNKYLFPKTIQQQMLEIEKISKDGKKIIIQIASSYSGRNEIVLAMQKIAQMVKNNIIDPKNIDENLISNNIFTVGIPDPDLLIRTGGEFRISNFLIWQISYCELFFSVKMWPAFNRKDLHDAINEFNLRERRYGKY